MEEQTEQSNDATGLSVPQQETTFEEEETSPPQGTSADPLTQIADALNELLDARSPREIDVSPYDGTYEAQSFFDNFDAQADRAKLTYTDRLRKLPCYLQDFNNLQIYQNNDALPTNVYKVTKCKQDLCPTQPRKTDIFTTFPSNQSCLHVADPTPIICSPTIVSPTISPTHDIEISIPSNATPQLEHCPHELHRIPYEFSHVFSTNKYNVPKLNIPPVKINTTTDKIIALRPYRVPLHDQQEIQTQIEQMLQHGIIAPSVSPYASPITLVTKRDKTKRFCIDYRKLNEIIAPDVHPLPLIETILDKLSKAKYYSSVDIASAYWQVEVELNSRYLLAFVTLDSQYEFCRLPYGFKNSPQIYHRAINQVMQKYKLNFVTHYFDDFIIFSDTLEDHLQHLQQFLTVCQHENIKLNYNKCSFFKTNIDFLGYTVTAGTYAPQTRNLDTISAIKPPTNQKTLQSFLGAVNVYNKFIPDYARLRAPLNKLLKKDVKWNWDPDCQQAFTTLKESLTSKPVLHLYQVGLPCRLYCDASTQGIAGILKQVHPDGQVQPVQYFSRALRAHERNYTVSELECLAIVESVDKFRIYLTGIKFTIYTDHQALQWLKTIKNPSGRLFRWSLRLSTYNYEIHYLKGSQQYEADLLSRNPFVGFVSADIIKQHQPTASPFNIDTNGLHTITRKGVIKIIIPETLQHTLMNKVHQEYNHPGISQMTRIITAQYYWKGISKSIEKFVKSCHTCQIIKRPKGKPYGALGQIPPPQQPFDLISIDTIAGFSKYGHSKTYLHVIVDHLTRYAWTFPSKSTSTLTYIQTLKTVLQQGSPKRLLSDRAPAFTSEKFRKFLITHGIQPLLTTSNNPQANGLIERLNATITGKLRLAYLENPKASWTQLVKRVTQTYNNTPHSVTSFPPTYLMFNVIPPDLRTHLNPYPEINIAREIANSCTQNKHKKDKETFDKQHRTPHFEVNDLVLVKNYRHPDTGKLAPYFTGPYKIIEIISPNVVRIDRPNQPLNRDSDTIHVNKLKYYTENVLYITPPQTRFAQNPQRLSQDALIHYSMKLPLTLTCDASAYGISGVLCHIVEGEEKPITFVSRTLSSAEVKYSQTEKEALAIVFATSKLRQYLFGRKFVLKSDHKALTTVFGNKRLLPPLIANRLHRWALELSNFDFDIRYTNKDTMLCADAFSRLPLEEINSREDNIDLVTHDISFLNVTPLDHLIIEEETNKDPVLNKLKEYLLEDPQLAKKDETMKPFLSKLENFSVLQGCIFVDSRAVIPRSCQDQMLKLLHQSHIGINRMKSLARSSVWWPKMDSQIEEFVKECSPCMHHQTAPPAENTPWPRTNQPWQRVHVDHFYFRGDCYLLVVDANSNWIEVFPARGTTSQENIKLLRECFARNTPTSLDKPPVERLLSYVPRTFVNCLNSEFIQKTFGRNECGRRHFQVGDKVLFTRVIQNRRKWFKAQVIRRLGYNVYLVKNLKGTFKVHVIQMRTGSDTKYAEDSDWTLDNAGAGPHRLEQDPQISTSPPPRRSTRPRCPPCRIKRWSLKLAAFNYTVEFRKTSDNSNVDALSRLPLESSVRESLDEDQ
ncbi:hypothetical protein LAZ67_X002982, partial [Cordylochernes scorpioides]